MKPSIKRLIGDNRVFIITVLVALAAAVISPVFISQNNIYALFLQMPAYGFAALGLTWCFICNELDVSMGSVMALTAVVFALIAPTYGFILGLLAAVIVGAVCGLYCRALCGGL